MAQLKAVLDSSVLLAILRVLLVPDLVEHILLNSEIALRVDYLALLDQSADRHQEVRVVDVLLVLLLQEVPDVLAKGAAVVACALDGVRNGIQVIADNLLEELLVIVRVVDVPCHCVHVGLLLSLDAVASLLKVPVLALILRMLLLHGAE